MKRKSLKILEENWDYLGSVDPLWAVLTHADKKFSRWGLDEFLKTGINDGEVLIKKILELNPDIEFKRMLDFGCGVGRLSKPLKKYFNEYFGVDISKLMIEYAREINKGSECIFIKNSESNLNLFPDNYFNLVYSRLVLQHIPEKDLIKEYISEFVRILKTGGIIIFQLPVYLEGFNNIKPREIAYRFLKNLGINKKILYKIGVYSMHMNFIPEEEVLENLNLLGVKILKIENEESAGQINKSNTYYITK